MLWATIIVKATFRLVHDAPAQLVNPLDVVRVDHCCPTGSLEEAAETAPYIPNVGVILSGHACAPQGRPIASAAVHLGLVGAGARRSVDKTLHVFGDRSRVGDGAVQLFERMPLVYERACGGPDNPVGVAFGSAVLPNVVDAVDPHRPGGFGPIASHWPTRRRLLGSVAPTVLETSIPELPAGFDWRYFQAAPANQQLDALHGGEWIVLDGLHPALPRVQTRLPDAVARVEWSIATAQGSGPVRPIAVYADTLVIDTERLSCSVVWRGRVAIERPDTLSAISVSAGVENPKPPTLTPSGATPGARVPRVGGG